MLSLHVHSVASYGLRLMGCTLVVLGWCMRLYGQERTTESTVPNKIDPLAGIAKKYLSEPVVDPNERPIVEERAFLQRGEELRFSTVKRMLRNAETGEIRKDSHLRVLMLDLNRRPGGQLERLLSFSLEQRPWPLTDYMEPYGFHICTDRAPRVVVSFIDDMFLYFIEWDVTSPPSQSTKFADYEVVNLVSLARKPFGTANYEPKFVIEKVLHRDNHWHVTVSLQSRPNHRATFKRTAPNTWTEIPSRETQ